MDHDYPQLQIVLGFYNKIPHDVRDIYLVCCQHIMEPQLQMFRHLISFGFDPAKILVLGKAYSTNNDVLEEIKASGIRAIQPEFSGIDFDLEHKRNCELLLGYVPEDAKCIVLDDGAQLIKTFRDHGRNVLFAVEQTSSGFRRLEGESIHFPVINVARSVIKLTQEAPLVARHLGERIISYLKEKEMNNPSVLVVGLGPIGESIFEFFKQSGLPVEGFDTKYGHNDLISKIKDLQPNVIIGATGNQILTKDELEALSINGALYLISASSSDREFPVSLYRSGEGAHQDVIHDNIVFVNNGFPFSFMGNRYEMTPPEIEKTMCLLGGSVMYGSVNNLSQKGLLDVPLELESLVNDKD